MDDIDESEEKTPNWTPVKTIGEAVDISLQHSVLDKRLFVFARALKAFQLTMKCKLSPTELNNAFVLWWQTARQQGLVQEEDDRDEHRFEFLGSYASTKAPLGANPLVEAIRMADTSPPPPEAARYSGQKIKRLVGVCSQLQQINGNAPFYMGVRDAGEICGTKSLISASAFLNGLVGDGVLTVILKGKPGGTKATRFQFNFLPQQPSI